MYNVGDLVFYGSTGVCRIVEIKKPNVVKEKEERLYYTLKPLYQECMISTPVDNDKVFMRPIITKEEAERIIDTIPNIQAEAYYNRALSQLSEHYAETIKTHSCKKLLELTMSIYAKKQDAKKQNKKFGAIDERFMKRAEELLFGELAAALNIKKEEVMPYIEARVEAQKNGEK